MFVEAPGSVQTRVAGEPSLGTMTAFIITGIGGLLSLRKPPAWPGLLIGAISTVALFGYVLNQPVLYYYVQEQSTAMALHTALAFELIGLWWHGRWLTG